SESLGVPVREREVLEFLNANFGSLEALEAGLASVLASEVEVLERIEREVEQQKRVARGKLTQLQERCAEAAQRLAKLKASYPRLQNEIAKISEEPDWLKEVAQACQLAERREAALGFLYFARKSLAICAQAEVDSKAATTARVATYQQVVDGVDFLRRQMQRPGDAKFYSHRLLEHLETRALRMNLHIQKALTKRFEDTLEAMGWPQEVDLPQLAHDSPGLLKSFRAQYQELARFQELTRDFTPALDKITTGILPLDIMIKAIVIRFYYHFMGPRPTNSLGRPEWFLGYVLDMTTCHLGFMGQLHLEQAFLTSMADLVGLKVESVRDSACKPPHLSHFVKELLEFDHAVAAAASGLYWEGCAGLLLRDEACFYAWLDEEQRVVEHRLNEILQAPNAWDPVNATEGGLDCDRPTLAADRVSSLFEAILGRYVHLRPVHLQIRYFAQVHLSLVQGFYQELLKLVNRYERRITGFRPPGAPRVDYFPPVAISLMAGYDTQPFFLEMWEVIQSKSSSTGLFDELSDAYTKLAHKATRLVGDGLAREFSRDLRPWAMLNPWSESAPLGEAELASALTLLRSHLQLTSRLHRTAQLGALQEFATKLEGKLLKLIPAGRPPDHVARDVTRILDALSPICPHPSTLFPKLDEVLGLTDRRSEGDSLV
ncbi:hypothetical protein L0F63_000690, partial [Massospora cicadina]